MVKTSSKERRAYIRAKRILSIEYRLHKPVNKRILDKKWHLSTTHDMSAGGISFYSDQFFKIDDVLEIRVTMSGLLDIFSGYAKVIRVMQKKTGVTSLIALQLIDKKQPSAKRTAVKSKQKLARI